MPPLNDDWLRQMWDKYAPRYHRDITFFERLVFAGGRQWVCSQPTGDVLEVAVGTGRNLLFYPDSIRRLTGIDLQDSGNRETHLAATLARLEASFRRPAGRPRILRRGHPQLPDSGNTANMRGSLTALAVCLDRLGRSEPAAIIVGFAFDPLTTGAWVPEINTAISHLRDVLKKQRWSRASH